MGTFLSNVFAGWLTPFYVLMLAVITLAVIQNVLKEENLPQQLVGGLILIPLLLRVFMIK
ncbi:MAG: hypothetical protein GX249_02890 [Firmicutes bacterium]|nr:hypothetical protein [Bacillota bacterium]